MADSKTTEGSKPSVVEVELVDERDNPIGVTMRVEIGPETDDLSAAPDRVRGWTKLVLDGQPYTFSKERSAQLLARFPHFARTVLAAGKAN